MAENESLAALYAEARIRGALFDLGDRAQWRLLGADRVRVNLVAAGPVKTMAAKSIPGFASFEDTWAERAPLGWDVLDTDVVAKACLALLSDLLPMTTGELLHVDGGVHAVGA